MKSFPPLKRFQAPILFALVCMIALLLPACTERNEEKTSALTRAQQEMELKDGCAKFNRDGNAAYEAGDFKKAERLLDLSMKCYGQTVEAQLDRPPMRDIWLDGYHDLGWIRIGLKEYEKAILNFDSAAKYSADRFDFLFETLGFASRLAGKNDDAERWFRQSIDSKPTKDNRIAILNLALLYCETGRSQDQTVQEERLFELDAQLNPPMDLFAWNGAAAWKYDQVYQEAYHRSRLTTDIGSVKAQCVPLTYRTLVAFENNSWMLQQSGHPEKLDAMEKTIDLGRTLLGPDHKALAEALFFLGLVKWRQALTHYDDPSGCTAPWPGAGTHAREAACDNGRPILNPSASRIGPRYKQAVQNFDEALAILDRSNVPSEGLRKRIVSKRDWTLRELEKP